MSVNKKMAVSSCPRVFPSFFECRSDPEFSGAPKTSGGWQRKPSQSRFFGSRLNSASAQGAILRFPPNFVRQLSTKARRNCSNIGVAQIVAASWSNNSNPSSPPPAAASSSAAAAAATAATEPIAPIGDDVALLGKEVDLKANVNLELPLETEDKEEALPIPKLSIFSCDGSLAIHAGTTLSLSLSLSIYIYIYVCIYVCLLFRYNKDLNLWLPILKLLIFILFKNLSDSMVIYVKFMGIMLCLCMYRYVCMCVCVDGFN